MIVHDIADRRVELVERLDVESVIGMKSSDSSVPGKVFAGWPGAAGGKWF